MEYLDFVINLKNVELDNMKTYDDSFWNIDEQRISVKLLQTVNILYAYRNEKRHWIYQITEML